MTQNRRRSQSQQNQQNQDDQNRPDAPVITSPVTGSSVPTNYKITGSAVAGTITIFDGEESIGTVENEGEWTYEVENASEGGHALSACVTVDGNESEWSPVVNVTVDPSQAPDDSRLGQASMPGVSGVEPSINSGDAEAADAAHQHEADRKANLDKVSKTHTLAPRAVPEGKIIPPGEPVEIEAEDAGAGVVRVVKDHWREVIPFRSKRATHVLLYRAGTLLPKNTLQKINAEADRRKQNDGE